MPFDTKRTLRTLTQLAVVVVIFLPAIIAFVTGLEINRITREWLEHPTLPLDQISLDTVYGEVHPLSKHYPISDPESLALAESLLAWIESQQSGSQEKFETFRYAHLAADQFKSSPDAHSYYHRFLEDRPQTRPMEEQQDSVDTDLIDELYAAREDEAALRLRQHRLCLDCVESVALNSLKLEASPGPPLPMETFLTEGHQLNVSWHPQLLAPAQSLRDRIAGLEDTTKSVHLSFLVRTGTEANQTFRVGLQFVWLPETETWLPLDMKTVHPGKREPLEVFLF